MNRPHPTVMVRLVVRTLVPLLQLFGLYVVFHGHYSPGGGFQGGVLLASSYVLIGIGLGRDELDRRVTEHGLVVAAALGVVLFAGVGGAALAAGLPFLDYAALAPLTDGSAAQRSLGILLVEVGVAITVAAVIVLIFMRLADGDEEPS